MLAADLKGKTALVTGGARGLGRAIALELAEHGVSAAVADLALEDAQTVCDDLAGFGVVSTAIEMDVSNRKAVAMGVAKAAHALGRIDILVNNAGVTGASGWIAADEDRDEDWDACYRVNLLGIVHCCKETIPLMAARRYGKIVNIASMSGRATSEQPEDALLGRPSNLPYAVSKAGVIRYTQKLAPLAAVDNINVNTVCPGSLLTDFGLDIVRRQQHVRDERADGQLVEVRRAMVTRSNLFRRDLTPTDVAKMVAFLSSDDARNITGAAFHVDGGAVMV